MNKLTIRSRFLLLSIIALLMFFILGAFIHNGIQQVEMLSNDIMGPPTTISDASIRIEKNIVKMHREMKDVVLSKTELERRKSIDIVNKLEQQVYEDIGLINDNVLGEEGKKLLEKGTILFDKWKPIREEVVSFIISGDYQAARDITIGKGANHVKLLENSFSTLAKHARGHIENYLVSINKESNSIGKIFVNLLVITLILFVFVNLTTFKGILDEIDTLKISIGNIIKTKQYNRTEIIGENEISDLARRFNSLIDMLNNIFSQKNSISELQSILSEKNKIKRLADSYISFCIDKTDSCYGSFYIIDFESNVFRYLTGFSYSKECNYEKKFKHGEGIIGQVALKKEPILLNDLKKENLIINAGCTDIIPSNIYVYPIISKDNRTVAVIEIASVNKLTDEQIEFIKLTTELLPPYILNIERSERIDDLLDNSKKINRKLTQKSYELEQNSKELENINRELEQNSQEMEQVNLELEQQKKQLIEKSKELEKANNLKSEFLANISHELRTPLNSIILLSDILTKRDSISKDEREKILVINNAGSELLELINNLLDISKIESGKLDVIKEEVSTIDLSERLHRKFKDIADSKNIRFIIKDEIRVIFKSDKQKLLQILTNFLSNAFKFTTEGFVELTFKKSDIKGYGIQISIKDTGIGIRKDKRDIIFEEFRQEDSSVTREFGGTGLGLSICEKLTGLLNGKLNLESELNKGSTFTIYLPLIDEYKERLNTRENMITKDDNYVNITISDDISKGDRFILLIEDDNDFASRIKKQINELGYKVKIAKNGYEGIMESTNIIPNGIVLDLILPDISGARVLKELKINPITRGIPVQILTVKDNSEELSLKKMGAIGYTRKTPFIDIDAKEVIKSIEKVINKKPKSILIVEDEKEEVKILKKLFIDWNLDIDSTDNVKESIQKINKYDFDAIIVDLSLKDGSGWDICKYVKQNKINIPIIVYTAKSLSDKEYTKQKKYSDSIILKSADSRGNLLEEIAIFIHKVYEWKEEKYDNKSFDKLRNKTILICDDDSRNVFALSSLLEEFNVNILETYNGKEAIEVIRKNDNIDMILMDIMMPKMDGIEAIKIIRKNKKYRDIPILALTAKAMKGDRENCIEAGANDYLSKPIDMDMLLKLIVMWIGEKL